MIAILNYQAGNLASVKKAIDYLGHACVVASDPRAVERADRIVLPGVGHFSATSALAAQGLDDVLRRALARGVPVLGICLGMQWLFEASDEAPEIAGLAAFPGRCRRFPREVKSPHVGWNQLELRETRRLFHGIDSGAFVYFTHSYWTPVVEDTVAVCEHGGTFSAAVERGNLFGVQFHPEKSGDLGLALLKNFCEL